MGCDLIRFSYPDSSSKELFKKICTSSPMPVVADIHFDYRLALESIEAGAAKIRLNPGNIGAKWKVEEVVKKALGEGVALRIGLNGASLPPKMRNSDHAEAMVNLALEYLEWFEGWGFYNSVISLKDSDPETTYRAYLDIAKRCDYPLHLGVTEAGGLSQPWPVLRGLRASLSAGIGDTLRISTAMRVNMRLWSAWNFKKCWLEKGHQSCLLSPLWTLLFDSHAFLKRVEQRLSQIPLDLRYYGSAMALVRLSMPTLYFSTIASFFMRRVLVKRLQLTKLKMFSLNA